MKNLSTLTAKLTINLKYKKYIQKLKYIFRNAFMNINFTENSIR